jgi:hypothetical protein
MAAGSARCLRLLLITLGRRMWPYYVLMLVAWGFTSAFGPLLIAHMRDATSSNRGALALIAGIVAISTLLPILVLPRRADQTNAIENRIASSPERGGCDRLASDNSKSSTRAVAELSSQTVA